MPAIHRLRRSHADMVLEDAQWTTAHGGQLIIDALARDFDLWGKICRLGPLDPRRDKSRGFGPDAIVSQLIFSLCSGGICLSDAGRLGMDTALGRLLDVSRWADESTLGEWLRAQTPESTNAFWSLIREFVGWVVERANPARVRHGGQLEVFFDDTQIEVGGRKFEGVGLNYEGNLAYSWQTLWVGPFVADAQWGPGNTDVSGALGQCLEATAGLWEQDAKKGRAHFYADSGSSAGKFLNLIDPWGWGWSVSYNKWTDKLDALAAAMAEDQWSAPQEGIGHKGEPIIEQFGWLRHLPGQECQRAQTFAVVRYQPKAGGELFWRYAFVVGDGLWQRGHLHEPAAARRVFERHHLKGAKEQGFHQLLGDLDLHHPRCLSNQANAMYYAVATMAFNLLMAVKILYLEDHHQGWTVRTLIRFWMTVPVKLSRHAHRTKARIFVPKAAMRWWRLFLAEHYPKRPMGRPPAVRLEPAPS